MQPSPPHNLEAEQALLGAIMLDNNAILSVPDKFNETHFFDPVHGKIYEVMRGIIDKGQVANGITMKARFAQDNALKEIGGASYLALLIDTAADPLSVEDYAQLILDLSLRRNLMTLGKELIANASSVSDELDGAETIINETESQLLDLQSGAVSKPQLKAGDLALQFVKDLRNGQRNGVKTGINALDDVIGTLEQGYLFLIGARPAMGKSAFMLQSAVNIAKSGHGVFIASMDMTNNQVTSRLISMFAKERIEYRYLTPENIKSEWQAAINAAAFEISQLPILIEDRRGRTVEDILSSARCARNAFQRQGIELGLACVDHVQKIRPARSNGNLYQESSDNARKLKDGAMQIKCPIMALSQLSRNVENREDKHPNMGDFRDTGAWEEEADLMAALYREAYYLRRLLDQAQDADEYQNLKDRLFEHSHSLDIDCLKVRQGEPQMVNLKIDIGVNRIYEKPTQLARAY